MDNTALSRALKKDKNGYLFHPKSHDSHVMEILNQQRYDQDQNCCDLTLLVEGSRVLAHKGVLAANSEYVRRQLSVLSNRKMNQSSPGFTCKKFHNDEFDKDSNFHAPWPTDPEGKHFKNRTRSAKATKSKLWNSGFLASVMTSSSVTSTPDVLPLPGIKLKYFEQVLDFMYTSSLSITQNNVFGLLLVSCFLQIRDLDEACIAVLTNEPKWESSTRKSFKVRHTKAALRLNSHRPISNAIPAVASRARSAPQLTKKRLASSDLNPHDTEKQQVICQNRVRSYSCAANQRTKVDPISANQKTETNLTDTPPRRDVFELKTNQKFLARETKSDNNKIKSTSVFDLHKISHQDGTHLWNNPGRKRFKCDESYSLSMTNRFDAKKQKRSEKTNLSSQSNSNLQFNDKSHTQTSVDKNIFHSNMYGLPPIIDFPCRSTPPTFYMQPNPLFVNEQLYTLPLLPQWPHFIDNIPPVPLDCSVPHINPQHLFRPGDRSPPQKYDVSNIKHLRKRKLLSAAYVDSETDSVGAVENCGEPLRVNSIEDFHSREDCDETTSTCLPVPGANIRLYPAGISSDVKALARQTAR